MNRLLALCGVCVICLVSAPNRLDAQSISSVNARIGIGFPLSSVVNPRISADSVDVVQLASIIESLGIGMDVELGNVVVFAPFLDIAVDEVIYSPDTQLVHPRSFVDIGAGDYTTVLIFYLGLPVFVKFNLGEFARIGVGISPTLVFRAPLSGKDRDTVGAYYVAQGRFFNPEAIIDIGYRFQEIELLLSARALFPISNAWDGDSSPFVQDMTFFVTIQLRFLLLDFAPADSANSSLSASR